MGRVFGRIEAKRNTLCHVQLLFHTPGAGAHKAQRGPVRNKVDGVVRRLADSDGIEPMGSHDHANALRFHATNRRSARRHSGLALPAGPPALR